MPSIRLVPFAPGHAQLIRLQPEQWQEVGPSVADAHALKLYQGGPGLTAFSDDAPLAAAGLVEVHPHYATAWALLGVEAGAAMLPITRAIERVLCEGVYARVDTTVRADFTAGHRWAWMLGFKRLGRLRRWGADGSDFDLYERINDGC